MAQAQADLEVAQARLTNADSQKRRADELFKSQSITEQEHEQALLDYANASAEVVRARVALDNAKDQLDDTNVRAPINGTIIEKQVERGQVISSPTNDVGGGTVLLKMADLNLVQVRTLVDETDIGKIQPGQRATVTVDAFPNRPFDGTVLKIEPQAQTEQNVTMFPVLVRIDNKEGLLRPGMNAEVEVHVGPPGQCAGGSQCRAAHPARCRLGGAGAGALSRDRPAAAGCRGPAGFGRADGPRLGIPPAGARLDRPRRRWARPPRPAPESSARRRPGRPDRPGHQRRATSRYIVFVSRNGKPTPVWIRTGLTDLDYSEVLGGFDRV